MAMAAQMLFGSPMPQYLNAITNATNQAIADTGTTSIFIMEGAEVDNKRIAKNPLTINLPDGKQVVSTHICDINIPGLPTMLTGHIVPSLKVALQIGIRPLCKAGCKVVFDNEKCEVIFNNKVILTGLKDPSMDLWTLLLLNGRMWTSPTSDTGTTPTLPRPGPCIDCAPHPPERQNKMHPGVNVAVFTHLVQTRANAVKFAHQPCVAPKFPRSSKLSYGGTSKGVPMQPKISKSKHSHGIRPHEVPMPRHQEHSAQSNTSRANRTGTSANN
jgi:hypothetical protein